MLGWVELWLSWGFDNNNNTYISYYWPNFDLTWNNNSNNRNYNYNYKKYQPSGEGGTCSLQNEAQNFEILFMCFFLDAL